MTNDYLRSDIVDLRERVNKLEDSQAKIVGVVLVLSVIVPAAITLIPSFLP